MNIIHTYYIHHAIVMWLTVLCCFTAIQKTFPLASWECPSDEHYTISPEEVGLLGTYCFVSTVNLDIQLFSHSVFAYYTVDKYAYSDAVTIILSEILNHLLNQFVQKQWWNKWQSLWVSQWIIHSTSLFKNTNLFRIKTRDGLYGWVIELFTQTICSRD